MESCIGVGVGVLYSITTFMREITPLLQIRQVAHLVEHHMQPARAPRAKEHTNNPVQRPNFRGQGATKLRDNEMEALKRSPTKGRRKNDTTLKAVRGECRRHPPRPRGQERGAGLPCWLLPHCSRISALSAGVEEEAPEPPKKPRQYNCQRFWNRLCPTPPP